MGIVKVDFDFRIQTFVILAVITLCTGCGKSPTNVPASNSAPGLLDAPDLIYEDPARKEVEEIFESFESYTGAEYRNLPRRDRYLIDVVWFETDVTQGGLDLYFYNPAGDHALDCLEALTAIGAHESASLLREACNLFPEGRPSPDRDQRRLQLNEITGGYDMIDDYIDGSIEQELFRLLLEYYEHTDSIE